MPTPRPGHARAPFLLMLGVATCLLNWHPAFRDAVADNAVRQEPVPSNIISVEPARPAPSSATGASASPPVREAPAAPALATPAATTPMESAPEPELETPEPVEASLSPALDTAPDEAALWELFNAGRPDEVLREIARLRQEFPAWNPPSELVRITRNEIARKTVERAIATKDHAALVEFARQDQRFFSCSNINWAWSLAEAYVALGRPEVLFGLLAGLIDTCLERDRLATLQKAATWLDPDSWERLADRESANERTPAVDAEFFRARYDHSIEQLLAAKKANDPMEFFPRFERLSTAVELYQDANIAVLAGWSFLDVRDTANAALWFGKAKSWDPAGVDALRGLAHCALAERRYADARRLADEIADGTEGRQQILRDAALGMAQAEYAQKNYASALQLLADAGPTTELPRYAQLMAAWGLLHSGSGSQALDLFQELHRQQPDEESAQGIFNALISTTDAGTLQHYPADEFLAPLIQKYRADQFYLKKRFLAARDFAPEVYGTAGGAGTPRVAWHGMLRDKSGTTGLSKLQDTVNSLEAVWPVPGRSELRFRLDHHQLDSGHFGQEPRLYLAGGLLTGALGIANDDPAFTGLAEIGADALRVSGAGADVPAWEPHLTWHSESRFDVEADVGLSVLGGVLDPHVIGHLSLRDGNERGSYAITGYVKPIRESILAYMGWRLDRFLPATSFNGEKWGGVRAAGAELSGYRSLGYGFGANGKIGVEEIDAKNVRENTHEFLLAGLNHGLTLKGFDYFAAGFSFGYDHYQRNLSQFTPGHGGYFSPQTFSQFKANLDFLTLENRRAIVKGHLDGGRVLKREAATPIIPLAGFSDQGFFPGNREWGWAYTVELNGAMQVGHHVQLGAHFSHRAAPQFDETAGMLFIRVLFEPRNSVLSSDLPGRVIDGIR